MGVCFNKDEETNSEGVNKIQQFNQDQFSTIRISNQYKSTVFIRVSSYFSTDSIEWQSLDFNSEKIWVRKYGSYFVEYALVPMEGKGPVVIMLTGDSYAIGEDFRIRNSNKMTIPTTYEDFPDFVDINNDGINDKISAAQKVMKFKLNRKENSENDKKGLLQNCGESVEYNVSVSIQSGRIGIVNFSSSTIRVRIKARGSGSEAFFPLYQGTLDYWNRQDGYEYLMEIEIPGNKKCHFKVKTRNAYIFYDGSILNDFNSNEIPQVYESFDGIEPNNNNNSNVNRKDNKIRISNKCNYRIYVRIQSKGKGSEDIFAIEAGREDNWARDDGTYMIEFIKGEYRYRFYVNSNKAYYFTESNQLFDSDLNVQIRPTNDNSFNNSNSGQDSKNDNTGGNSNSNSNNDSSVPYWNNKRPVTSGGLFTDSDFPPQKRIINSLDAYNRKTTPKFLHCDDEYIQDNYITFKRPSDIWGKNYHLFNNDITTDDVKQGGIGDCYLIATFAALCRRPELIKNIFKTKDTNPQGLYEIYIYYQGKKQIIYVDDYLICSSNYGSDSFKFADPNGSELWVLLLEKAFAKFEGGYSNIVGGVCHETLQFFTGAACTKYSKGEISSAWEEIKTAIAKNNIITCGSNQGTGSHDDKSYYSIHYSHAYSVHDAREYDDGNTNLKLIKVRNPWGTGEWTGSFSDNSSRWTPKLKQYFNLEVVDDGSFWMPFENFCQEFSNLEICYVSGKR